MVISFFFEKRLLIQGVQKMKLFQIFSAGSAYSPTTKITYICK